MTAQADRRPAYGADLNSIVNGSSRARDEAIERQRARLGAVVDYQLVIADTHPDFQVPRGGFARFRLRAIMRQRDEARAALLEAEAGDDLEAIRARLAELEELDRKEAATALGVLSTTFSASSEQVAEVLAEVKQHGQEHDEGHCIEDPSPE